MLGHILEREAATLELGGDGSRVGRHRTCVQRAPGLVDDANDHDRGVGCPARSGGDRPHGLVQAVGLSERHPSLDERVETALSERCPPMIWTRHLPDPPTSIVQDSGTGQH